VQKPPTWRANCWCFGLSTSEFVFARLARMVYKKDTMVYTGSGGMSLHQVRAAHVLALVCIRGYKLSREGMRSQVSGGEVSCEYVSF
jgi:hypothetical protein